MNRMSKDGEGVKRLIQWINSSRNGTRPYDNSHDPLRNNLADVLDASNFARRLKTLSGLTPFE